MDASADPWGVASATPPPKSAPDPWGVAEAKPAQAPVTTEAPPEPRDEEDERLERDLENGGIKSVGGPQGWEARNPQPGPRTGPQIQEEETPAKTPPIVSVFARKPPAPATPFVQAPAAPGARMA